MQHLFLLFPIQRKISDSLSLVLLALSQYHSSIDGLLLLTSVPLLTCPLYSYIDAGQFSILLSHQENANC